MAAGGRWVRFQEGKKLVPHREGGWGSSLLLHLLPSPGQKNRRAAGYGPTDTAIAIPRRPLRGSLALVVTVRRAALAGEAVAGAGPPEGMYFSGLCVTAAGGTVTEAGEGWPDFHALCCDRALNSLPELEREEGQMCGLGASCSDSCPALPLDKLGISLRAILEVDMA